MVDRFPSAPMLDRRVALHNTLLEVSGLPRDQVYFQPPATLVLKYPCVIYERDSLYEKSADNNSYRSVWRYSVMVIDKNPDSEYVNKIRSLPQCAFSRHYTKDNLNHDVFSLYF